MNSAQRIHQDSGDTEYYTPLEIVDAARVVMGGIDLDPASSEAANRRVRADRIFTAADDGLKQEWRGRVWMNHPFSKGEKACKPSCAKKACRERGYHLDSDMPGNKHWIDKLLDEFARGHVTEACCITYAATSEKWFRPLLAYPQCFLYPRTNYLLPDGSVKRGVLKGSAVTYLGDGLHRFVTAFHRLGVVKVVA